MKNVFIKYFYALTHFIFTLLATDFITFIVLWNCMDSITQFGVRFFKKSSFKIQLNGFLDFKILSFV